MPTSQTFPSWTRRNSTPDRADIGDDRALIDVKRLHKKYGELHIIQGLDLQVLQGEKHALIGPNGAGKSTLFALLSGLIPPTSGEILLRGRNIAGMPPHLINRQGVGRSFQITNIFGNLSVLENIRIGMLARHDIRFGLALTLRGMKSINDEAMALIESVHLKEKAGVVAGVLSYSEQRALEIGLTLATDPKIILLDEPTAGMSKDETHQIIELIRRVSQGRTLLMVEHDMDVVFNLCDRISVLVYGTILTSGSPDAIRKNAKVREAYLGEGFA